MKRKDTSVAILDALIARDPSLGSLRESLLEAFDVLAQCYADGGKLLICGNGGSAADAQHIVGELMKAFILPRRIPDGDVRRIHASAPDAEYICQNLQGALPAVSLVGELALQTAFENDVAPDMCFAQMVYGYGRPGDVLLGISTSGNSRNVLLAAQVAEAMDMKVIALTGASGGKLKATCDVLLNAPQSETYRVQEMHLPIYHALCLALENEFFGDAVE